MVDEVLKKKIIELKCEGFTYKHLSKKYGYTVELIKSWCNKEKKKTNTYNLDHVDEKYAVNKEFFEEINPNNILDLYCGRNRFWDSYYGKRCKVISNDIKQDPEANPDLIIKADQLLKAYSMVDQQFDLIDIDPFGSPKECIETGIKLAKKGLIITFGDFKSYKRFSSDEVNLFYKYYGIKVPKNKITIEHLAKYVEKLSNNKFKIWEIISWKNCDRVYFIANNLEEEN